MGEQPPHRAGGLEEGDDNGEWQIGVGVNSRGKALGDVWMGGDGDWEWDKIRRYCILAICSSHLI